MNRNAAAILEQAEEYVHLLDRVTPFSATPIASDLPIRLSSDQELLDGLASLSLLGRLVEAERIKLAGEVQRRSAIGDDSSLAKRMGSTSPVGLVAERAGLSRSAASLLVRLGEDIRPRESLSGEPLPPERPALAAALASGLVSTSLALAITSALDKVVHALSAEELLDLEAQILDRVGEGYTVDELLAWLKRVPDYADPEGTERRQNDLDAQAKVVKVQLRSGLTRWILDLDPLTAGLFETALDAGSSLRRGPLFLDGEADDSDSVSEAEAAAEQADRRPRKQRRVDGVRLMATRALKMDDGDVGGTAVTLVVTIDERSLLDRVGSACIDGVGGVSAGVARMLAASAEIIPVVLGGESQPLDLGLGKRFFTRAQRRAMAVRDGGCAGPGCSMPPSACDAAHIRPAGWGPTSVDNGVLLCWHCHKLLDLHGWQIRRERGRWWWTPPPWVDPRGRRRPGGVVPPPCLAA